MSRLNSSRGKSRLGRGLSSLISVSELPVEAEAQPTEGGNAAELPTSMPAQPVGATELPIDRITPNPHQPRRRFDDASLAELASSLRSTGLIQPIIVRQVDGGYELVAGERRLRAAKLAGLSAIPALIKEVDAFAQAQMALVENIQREDLNPIERAAAYRSLIQQLGLTQSELAGRLGEDRSSIANYLRLLDLAEPVQNLVRDGRLSMGHAKLLAGVEDPLEQQRLAELVLAQGLSVRNLERLLQSPGGTQTNVAAGPSAHIQDLEKSISRQLGMRTQIRAGSKKGRGKLVVHYSNLDQFDELLGRLGIKVDMDG